MGVNNLWQLLSPAGRRINVETLSRKTLAVDVSIWLVQFIKAMRDDEGKTVRNAHLIGTFRRLAKLLFHRIKPVVVFDGGVPTLKRRTVELRRLRRHLTEQSLRQQAQTILVAQLKRQIESDKKIQEMNANGSGNDALSGFAPGFNPGSQGAAVGASAVVASALATSALSKSETAARESGFLQSSELEVVVDAANNSTEEDDSDIEWEDGDVRNVSQTGDGSNGEVNGFDWDVGVGDVDESSLRAMPAGMRKNIIESVHKNFRKRSRDSYLSVAGDMDAYSEAQVTSFLRVSQFNQKVWNVAKSSTETHSEGRQIASDSSRKFFLGSKTGFVKAAASWKQESSIGPKLGSTQAMSTWLNEQSSASTSAPSLIGDTTTHERKRLRKKFQNAACVDSDSEDDLLESSDLAVLTPTSNKDVYVEDSTDCNGGFILDEEVPAFESNTQVQLTATPSTRSPPASQAAIRDLSELAPVSLDVLRDWPVQDHLNMAMQRSLEDQGGIRNDEKLQEILMTWGLEVEAVDGDNNCLFSALSLQLSRIGRSKFSSESIRSYIVGWMRRHGDLVIGQDSQGGTATLSQFAEGNWLTYLSNMEIHKGAWGDHCVLIAAAIIFKLRIHIFSVLNSGEPLTLVAPPGIPEEFSDGVSRGDSLEVVCLGHYPEYHYVSTRPTYEVFDSAEGCRSLAIDVDSPGKNPQTEVEAVAPDISLQEAGAEVEVEIPEEFMAMLRRTQANREESLVEESSNNDNSDDDTDDWEDGATGAQSENDDSSVAESGDPLKEGKSREEALIAAMSTADGLASWASRVVRRVITQHTGPSQPTNLPIHEVSEVGYAPNTSDDDSKKPQGQSLMTGGAEMPAQDLFIVDDEEPADDTPKAAPPPVIPVAHTAAEYSGDALHDDIDQGIAQSYTSKVTRDSENISPEMIDEVKELLRLFGIPFIVAPMEAEAQCAALEEIGVVNGVVTDDSDAFLFGAKTVYKNIFEDKKYVEAYYATDLQSELGLARHDMIALGMLLGCDYTMGVKGVGIVNAMEILDAFPAAGDKSEDELLSGLKAFREWHARYDPVAEALEKAKKSTESKSPQKTKKKSNITKAAAVQAVENETVEENEADVHAEDERNTKDEDSSAASTKARAHFEKNHQNARKRWQLAENFPDPAVMKAFIKPVVTRTLESDSNLAWRPPNVEGIRRFAAERMGWNPQETECHLGPVLAQLALEDSGAGQTRLDSFYLAYHDNTRFAAVRSKRLEGALAGRTGRPPRSRPPTTVSEVPPTEPVPETAPRLGEVTTGADVTGELDAASKTKASAGGKRKGKSAKKGAAKKVVPRPEAATAKSVKTTTEQSRRNPSRQTRPPTFSTGQVDSGSEGSNFERDCAVDEGSNDDE